ncbi:uncharacterized protein EDB93DRAFT_1330725 [Suillus bovinus]|uniref:uncharacterized protein n=1 Tax=Suillus bovinus TaxID=48563 RepID=UPI001B87190F|nr:uncharacterized protein EDB93DRAFT_1330725 [Suillus bovinus]KAG2137140.1 hypothetical protein EDB93DRAFT_1330725 [Suillus bovinus]
MTEQHSVIRITTPSQTFQGHRDSLFAVAAILDGRGRMVTASYDKKLRLWNLEDGVVLKIMEGHTFGIRELAVSKDGEWIVSGDDGGRIIAWNKDGESLTQPIKVHSKQIGSLDFSPDSTSLASGSWDTTVELWNPRTWQLQGEPISCGAEIRCVRYSPSGEYLAIATKNDIQIWNPFKRERIAKFQGHSAFNGAWNTTLLWTPDGKQLVSAGSTSDPTLRIWDSSTWQQVGEPCKGHTNFVFMIALNPAGTLLASASKDCQVRLWRLSDRRTIAILKHIDEAYCVTFSTDGKCILSGGKDAIISKWTVPLLEDILEDQETDDALRKDTVKEQVTNHILTIDTTARDACTSGDLPTACRLLTQDINTNSNDYNSYANRSFVMARKSDWDCALDDALKSMSIQPSLMGCISKGIALCGKGQLYGAMRAFDLAFMFVDADSDATHLLLLIKAIVFFNANHHDEAILRVQELATTCPSADTLACRVVEAYLRVQMGIKLNGVRYNEAVDQFTAAINAIPVSSTPDIHFKYDVFVVLFGWDLLSLWRTAYQNLCRVLLRAGRHAEALKSYRCMMDESDEATKASCLDWSTAFKRDCSALYVANGVTDVATKGDDAFAAGDYNRAIELYSAAIDLDVATDTIFANRSKARSERMLWDDALLDAQMVWLDQVALPRAHIAGFQVIALNPLSYVGYQLKHAALHGARRYDEAIEAFQVMLSKLDNAPDEQVPVLHRKYISLSEAEAAVQQIIHAQLDNAPYRLLNTFTGRLCDRQAQINTFTSSMEYKELLSFTMNHGGIQMERVNEVVEHFRWVMLSHRWEGAEPLLHDIRDKVVYDLNPLGGMTKLQSFFDQTNNVEVQLSVNSMFIWYRHSALTIVYLSDVPPSSMAGSAWNTRGWTVQEFLAPNIVLFYQKDWTPYLDDRSSNHKNSVAIMQEMGNATGIDARTLVAFRPGMRHAREKLQWVSARVTTWQEDIAYSLFGIFGINLPVIYGERRQRALGRLLQEVVAQSGDISALDWIGESSEFNSCLPANITSYTAPPYTLPSLPEDEIQTSVSLLRNTEAMESASKLYTFLDQMSAPRFANCRLHLPCITFRVTAVRRSHTQDQNSYTAYEVNADGLHDLLITTEDKLMPSSWTFATRQTFLLVRPWDRDLLELLEFSELSSLTGLPDIADDTQSEESYWSAPGSPLQDLPDGSLESEDSESVDLESSERALRLIVRLGQPFSAFLLAQQRGGEYKRIASDHAIIAQVNDVVFAQDIKILEIL